MASERVRIALDVCMDDDPEIQRDLAGILGEALVDAATFFGVDLGRSSCIIVTRPGGDTHHILIEEVGGAQVLDS